MEEGGSTITQQLVKQTLLQTADEAEERLAATEESVGRKLREARLALSLEETFSKDEILTRYLNTVYFGEGAYGVQAAARRYFSVDAADLSLAAGGDARRPRADADRGQPAGRPRAAPASAATRCCARMLDLGYITQAQHDEVAGRPVEVAPSPPPPNGCVDAVVGGFFCDFAQQYLTQTLGIPRRCSRRAAWRSRPRSARTCSAAGTPRCWPTCRWATRWPPCSPRSSRARGTCSR